MLNIIKKNEIWVLKLALVFEEVSKSFDDKVVLRDMSFEVRRGEIVSLLGPNGSGKTTALRIAVGLLKPSRGNVYIMGFSVFGDPVNSKKYLGYVPETPILYDNLTGFEYLELVLDLWRLNISDKYNEIIKLTRILDLEQSLEELTVNYSAGMKRKLMIIGALLHDPIVLIMDEITSNLDPKAIVTIKQLLEGLKDLNRAILISTHILEIAEELADRTLILRSGEIVWQGETRKFREEAIGEKKLEDIFFELTGGPEIASILDYLKRKNDDLNS